MTTILIEDDHFLKIVAVILDPETPAAWEKAVARFFAHDMPDFLDWRDGFRARLPGLYPARVVYADGQANFEAKLPEANGVIVESLRIDAAALGKAPKLAVVQKFGTLTRNIDLAACAAAGIPVETLRRVGNLAVAEQAFALMIALAKRVCELNGVVEERALAARGYSVRPRSPHIGYSNPAGVTGLKTLAGATLGIVGFGEVGREIARRASAFEMNVIYHQRTRLPPEEESRLSASYATLRDLMARSDHVIVQTPLNESTRGLIGRDAFAAAKPGLILVNVARAELIDRDALIEALDAGTVAGFGLDVGYTEPTDPAEPLLRYKDGTVILMPHTAIGARENGLRDIETLCLNLWRRICPAAARVASNDATIRR